MSLCVPLARVSHYFLLVTGKVEVSPVVLRAAVTYVSVVPAMTLAIAARGRFSNRTGLFGWGFG